MWFLHLPTYWLNITQCPEFFKILNFWKTVGKLMILQYSSFPEYLVGVFFPSTKTVFRNYKHFKKSFKIYFTYPGLLRKYITCTQLTFPSQWPKIITELQHPMFLRISMSFMDNLMLNSLIGQMRILQSREIIWCTLGLMHNKLTARPGLEWR